MMSMLAEQRKFEAEVKARFGLRERPTAASTVQRFADERSMSVEEADLALYSPLDRLSRGWCEAHAEHLKARLIELGLTHDSLTSQIGTDRGTLWRMLKSNVRPRIQTLAPVLEALGQTPQEYLALSSEKKDLRANPFAWALRGLREAHGMSIRDMARKLGVQGGHYGGWEAGRTYPRGEIGRRLEYALGVTIAESKAWELNRKETLDGLAPLGRLMRQTRLHCGWDIKEAAVQCGLSLSAYSAYEQGTYKKALHATLRKIADGLSLRYDEVSWTVFGALDPIGETFNQRLKRLRVERLISTNDVAEAMGIHPFVYRRYEATSYFPTYTKGRLEAMADAIGVTTSELLGEGSRFGEWLRKALADSSSTIEDLALVLGEEEATTEGWLVGHGKPTFKQAWVMAPFLKVTIHELREHLMS